MAAVDQNQKLVSYLSQDANVFFKRSFVVAIDRTVSDSSSPFARVNLFSARVLSGSALDTAI
jgi:hypothetical protein